MFQTQSFTELDALVSDLYRGARCILRPYMYVIPFTAPAANSTVTNTQKINGNADFILVDLWSSIGFDPTMYIQITDSASQETLFNTPANCSSVVNQYGTNVDRSLGFMKRFPANSNQVINLINQAGSPDFARSIILNGVNVFVMSQ